ncbi:MAG TPA: hydroxysqualene dehydroxylase HpnE [Ottowia sp.]|nr:hydroxysqualene dehydroxylase HpnE [Ottowia sp.]
MKVAIIGAGWAGMAAAVRATERGHDVTVFEAARTLGGRARGVPLALPDGRTVMADNGQHVLIGAYRDSLALMRTVGVDPDAALLRLPLTLRYPDGSGLALPDLPPPLDALAGILAARGWPWRDKLALLRTAQAWRAAGFACNPQLTVAQLCHALSPRLLGEFIEPLCISALNTPMAEASAQVFLRVLHDAMFSERGGSHLLIPRVDLSALLPDAAARWLAGRGGRVLTGRRVEALRWSAPHWHVDGEPFDRVILATSSFGAVLLLAQTAHVATQVIATKADEWCASAQLPHRPITTVYAQAADTDAPLPSPMLALRSSAPAPAQFVFRRDAIAPAATPTRLYAFVVSHSHGDAASLEAAVTAQAALQLGLRVTPLLTVTEKRATFSCTPALKRPPADVAPGLSVCGDYVAGPYPATLEGAVRSGLQAAEALR